MAEISVGCGGGRRRKDAGWVMRKVGSGGFGGGQEGGEETKNGRTPKMEGREVLLRR